MDGTTNGQFTQNNVNPNMNGMGAAPMQQNPGIPEEIQAGIPQITTAPVSEPPKKKVNALTIVLIVISIICLGVGIAGMVIGFGGGSGTSGNSGKQSSSDTNSDDTSSNVTSSGTNVELSGFEIRIPDGYSYDFLTSNGIRALAYSDNTTEYVAETYYEDAITFATLKNNISAIKDGAFAEGVVVKSSGVTTENGVEFVYAVCDFNGEELTYAFSEANLYLFVSVIQSMGSNPSNGYIDRVGEVLSSAKKLSGTNRAFGDNTDINDAKVNGSKILEMLSK